LNAAVWFDVPSLPVVVGTNNVAADAMDAPRKFYRLRNP
jgi:hypothetical protein